MCLKRLHRKMLNFKSQSYIATASTNIPYFMYSYTCFAGNPESLLNTVWLNNGVYFGLRGRQDHTNMLWGDIELKKTSDGKEYLEFTGEFDSVLLLKIKL